MKSDSPFKIENIQASKLHQTVIHVSRIANIASRTCFQECFVYWHILDWRHERHTTWSVMCIQRENIEICRQRRNCHNFVKLFLNTSSFERRRQSKFKLIAHLPANICAVELLKSHQEGGEKLRIICFVCITLARFASPFTPLAFDNKFKTGNKVCATYIWEALSIAAIHRSHTY